MIILSLLAIVLTAEEGDGTLFLRLKFTCWKFGPIADVIDCLPICRAKWLLRVSHPACALPMDIRKSVVRNGDYYKNQ